MGDRIDALFQRWHRLGAPVLVAEADADADVAPEPIEQLIAESTAHCRDSGRLTWVVLDGLIRHVDQIDDRALTATPGRVGDLSVLGVLCDAARQRRPDPKLERIMAVCPPNDRLEPFFHRVGRSRVASRLATDEALDLFRRWNFLSHELRYLGDGVGPLQPTSSAAPESVARDQDRHRIAARE